MLLDGAFRLHHEQRRELDRLTAAAAERPKFEFRVLTEGDHFWVEITNLGPNPVPDAPLVLNLLVPKTWNVHAGAGGWAPSREPLPSLDTSAKGDSIAAWLWSFKDDDPPPPRLSQTYEFQFNEMPDPGTYPISLRLFGYQKFDGKIKIAEPESIGPVY
jgi:hypothetical protein